MEIRCPLCNYSECVPYYEQDRRILKCGQCGVGFLSPELWIHDLDSYYHTNEAYAANSFVPGRSARMKSAALSLLKILRKYVHQPSGKYLLDVGANYGSLVEQALKQGFIAEGIEMNAELVKSAQERGIPEIQGNVSDIGKTSYYDVVTMIHVLEHVPDIHGALKKLYASLKEGGYFFVEVHNIGSYIAKQHRLSWKYVSPEHLYYFTPDNLSVLLEEHGFKVESVISRNQYLESFSIRYLLEYLFATKQNKDRFFRKDKSLLTREELIASQATSKRNIFKAIIHKVLVSTIKLMKREDLMLIVAKK